MKRDRPIILDGDADGPGDELERLFGRLREQQPDAQATQRATDRAREVLVSDAAARPRAGGVVGWRSLAAAAGVLLAAVVWLTLLGGELATPVWADVVRQSAGFETVKLVQREYEDGVLVDREDVFLAWPAAIRTHEYDVSVDPPVVRQGELATPASAIRWNLQTGLSEEVGTDDPYTGQADSARAMLAFLGVSVAGVDGVSDIVIDGVAARFEPTAERHTDDPTLRGFRLRSAAGSDAVNEMLNGMIYWFDARENVVRRISAGGSEGEGRSGETEVTFDPDLPADFFEMRSPAGVVPVESGVRARLSPEVREVYDAVRSARETFGDYRAVIWTGGIKKSPTLVESRRGTAWRGNGLDWAPFYNKERGLMPLRVGAEAAEAWNWVGETGLPLQMSAFRRPDGFALINFGLSGRGPRTSARRVADLRSLGRDTAWSMAFDQVAWPDWEDTENLHPHGRDLREPVLTWSRLPVDVNHPSWISVEGRRDTTHGRRRVRYSFDTDRDYLCVRWEEDDGIYVRVKRLEGLSQRVDGRWFPKVMRAGFTRRASAVPGADPERWSNTYTYAVLPGAAEADFFAWPDGAPEATDPFAPLKSRRLSRTPDSAPATARGKYTAVGANGFSRRGFADRASLDLHSEMQEGMRRIEAALTKNRHDHHRSRFVFPATLQELVDLGYLEVADLENPLYPGVDPGFVYLPPNPQWVNPTGRIMLYEPFEVWPGVVTLMFGDGSTEYVHDQAVFERLLKAARSPEDPPRRGE